jgi:hypothetical protein
MVICLFSIVIVGAVEHKMMMSCGGEYETKF